MLLIDAYNVLGTVGVLPPELAGLDVEDLAELIAYGRYRNRPAMLVCDGLPQAGRPGERFQATVAKRFVLRVRTTVEIVYAGPDSDADTFIERYVDADTAPTRLAVVSSDRRVQRAGRRRRATVLDAPTFLRQMIYDAAADAGPGGTGGGQQGGLRAQVPLSPHAIVYWKRLFGVTLADAPSEPPTEPPGDPSGGGAGASGLGADPLGDPDKTRSAGRPSPSDDPELASMLEECAEGVDVDDLDMSRWIPPVSSEPDPDAELGRWLDPPG